MHSDVHISMKESLEENLKAVDNKCSLQAELSTYILLNLNS